MVLSLRDCLGLRLSALGVLEGLCLNILKDQAVEGWEENDMLRNWPPGLGGAGWLSLMGTEFLLGMMEVSLSTLCKKHKWMSCISLQYWNLLKKINLLSYISSVGYNHWPRTLSFP